MTCPHCGETMVGDGYSEVLRCPYAEYEAYRYREPDAQPVCCAESTEKEKSEHDKNS